MTDELSKSIAKIFGYCHTQGISPQIILRSDYVNDEDPPTIKGECLSKFCNYIGLKAAFSQSVTISANKVFDSQFYQEDSATNDFNLAEKVLQDILQVISYYSINVKKILSILGENSDSNKFFSTLLRGCRYYMSSRRLDCISKLLGFVDENTHVNKIVATKRIIEQLSKQSKENEFQAGESFYEAAKSIKAYCISKSKPLKGLFEVNQEPLAQLSSLSSIKYQLSTIKYSCTSLDDKFLDMLNSEKQLSFLFFATKIGFIEYEESTETDYNDSIQESIEESSPIKKDDNKNEQSIKESIVLDQSKIDGSIYVPKSNVIEMISQFDKSTAYKKNEASVFQPIQSIAAPLIDHRYQIPIADITTQYNSQKESNILTQQSHPDKDQFTSISTMKNTFLSKRVNEPGKENQTTSNYSQDSNKTVYNDMPEISSLAKFSHAFVDFYKANGHTDSFYNFCVATFEPIVEGYLIVKEVFLKKCATFPLLLELSHLKQDYEEIINAITTKGRMSLIKISQILAKEECSSAYEIEEVIRTDNSKQLINYLACNMYMEIYQRNSKLASPDNLMPQLKNAISNQMQLNRFITQQFPKMEINSELVEQATKTEAAAKGDIEYVLIEAMQCCQKASQIINKEATKNADNLTSCFYTSDKQNIGFITKEDFLDCLKQYYIPPTDFIIMMEGASMCKDWIDYNKFIKYYNRPSKEPEPSSVAKGFTAITNLPSGSLDKKIREEPNQNQLLNQQAVNNGKAKQISTGDKEFAAISDMQVAFIEKRVPIQPTQQYSFANKEEESQHMESTLYNEPKYENNESKKFTPIQNIPSSTFDKRVPIENKIKDMENEAGKGFTPIQSIPSNALDKRVQQENKVKEPEKNEIGKEFTPIQSIPSNAINKRVQQESKAKEIEKNEAGKEFIPIESIPTNALEKRVPLNKVNEKEIENGKEFTPLQNIPSNSFDKRVPIESRPNNKENEDAKGFTPIQSLPYNAIDKRIPTESKVSKQEAEASKGFTPIQNIPPNALDKRVALENKHSDKENEAGKGFTPLQNLPPNVLDKRVQLVSQGERQTQKVEIQTPKFNNGANAPPNTDAENKATYIEHEENINQLTCFMEAFIEHYHKNTSQVSNQKEMFYNFCADSFTPIFNGYLVHKKTFKKFLSNVPSLAVFYQNLDDIIPCITEYDHISLIKLSKQLRGSGVEFNYEEALLLKQSKELVEYVAYNMYIAILRNQSNLSEYNSLATEIRQRFEDKSTLTSWTQSNFPNLKINQYLISLATRTTMAQDGTVDEIYNEAKQQCEKFVTTLNNQSSLNTSMLDSCKEKDVEKIGYITVVDMIQIANRKSVPHQDLISVIERITMCNGWVDYNLLMNYYANKPNQFISVSVLLDTTYKANTNYYQNHTVVPKPTDSIKENTYSIVFHPISEISLKFINTRVKKAKEVNPQPSNKFLSSLAECIRSSASNKEVSFYEFCQKSFQPIINGYLIAKTTFRNYLVSTPELATFADSTTSMNEVISPLVEKEYISLLNLSTQLFNETQSDDFAFERAFLKRQSRGIVLYIVYNLCVSVMKKRSTIDESELAKKLKPVFSNYSLLKSFITANFKDANINEKLLTYASRTGIELNGELENMCETANNQCRQLKESIEKGDPNAYNNIMEEFARIDTTGIEYISENQFSKVASKFGIDSIVSGIVQQCTMCSSWVNYKCFMNIYKKEIESSSEKKGHASGKKVHVPTSEKVEQMLNEFRANPNFSSIITALQNSKDQLLRSNSLFSMLGNIKEDLKSIILRRYSSNGNVKVKDVISFLSATTASIQISPPAKVNTSKRDTLSAKLADLVLKYKYDDIVNAFQKPDVNVTGEISIDDFKSVLEYFKIVITEKNKREFREFTTKSGIIGLGKVFKVIPSEGVNPDFKPKDVNMLYECIKIFIESKTIDKLDFISKLTTAQSVIENLRAIDYQLTANDQKLILHDMESTTGKDAGNKLKELMDLVEVSKPFTKFIESADSYFIAFILKLRPIINDILNELFSENPVEISKDLFIRVFREKTDQIYHPDAVKLFNWLDYYKNNSISRFIVETIFSEFIKMTENPQLFTDFNAILTQELIATFEKVDTNSDQKLSSEEAAKFLKFCFPYITNEESKTLVEKSDKNKNGIIEKEEFLNVMIPCIKQKLESTTDDMKDIEVLLRQQDYEKTGRATTSQL